MRRVLALRLHDLFRNTYPGVLALPAGRTRVSATGSAASAPVITPSGPLYLTPAEVAQLLRLSVKRVYALAASDPELPVLRLPGRGASLRFPAAQFQRWLDARTQGRPSFRNRVHALPKPAPQKEAGGA
ncbi:MAG: helix-turn-helix domain-containing protein [Candidatus Rokubacteria bacterium]|nr:helix-turn-helix domain-containing protein [Candidatus Rokubacteria bacterium]